jgi:hypothetical protein
MVSGFWCRKEPPPNNLVSKRCWSVGSNVLIVSPTEIEIWATSGRPPKYPLQLPYVLMRVLATGIEHALDWRRVRRGSRDAARGQATDDRSRV